MTLLPLFSSAAALLLTLSTPEFFRSCFTKTHAVRLKVERTWYLHWKHSLEYVPLQSFNVNVQKLVECQR
jgi:hypothetical protein